MSFASQLQAVVDDHNAKLRLADTERAARDAAIFTAFKAWYGLAPDCVVTLQDIENMTRLISKIQNTSVFLAAITAAVNPPL